VTRTVTVTVAVVLMALSACGGAGSSGQPAAEEPGGGGDSSFSKPPVESPGAESEEPDGGGGVQPVAVELPGLPIGGDQVDFAEPSSACVSLHVSGDPLPAGVHVAVRSFSVPPQFAVDGTPCGEAPPCLGGPPLSADSPNCQVAVVWGGAPVQGGRAELAVTSAVAVCEDAAQCQSELNAVQGSGLETIDLTVPAPD
jgi:hypothetical protein